MNRKKTNLAAINTEETCGNKTAAEGHTCAGGRMCRKESVRPDDGSSRKESSCVGKQVSREKSVWLDDGSSPKESSCVGKQVSREESVRPGKGAYLKESSCVGKQVSRKESVCPGEGGCLKESSCVSKQVSRKESVRPGDWRNCEYPPDRKLDQGMKNAQTCEIMEATADSTGSSFLVAQDEAAREQQKELLYEVLGPVFFGEKQAGSEPELERLFGDRYGIDVKNDFYEGDEHYEEYLEAQQAIAEGMSIYGGRIGFADGALAELAEKIWENMERRNGGRFRRINTMLEE